MKHHWQAKPAHLVCWTIWQTVTAGVVLDNKLLLYAVHLANRNCLLSCRLWLFLLFFLFFVVCLLFLLSLVTKILGQDILITEFGNSTAETQSLLLCWPFMFTTITIRRLFQESFSQMVIWLFYFSMHFPYWSIPNCSHPKWTSWH